MLSPLSHSRCSTNVNDLPLALCSCYKDHLTIEHHGYFETWRKNTEPGLEWECHFQNQGRRFLTAANLEINLSWWRLIFLGGLSVARDLPYWLQREIDSVGGQLAWHWVMLGNLLPADRGASLAHVLRGSTLDSAMYQHLGQETRASSSVSQALASPG